MSILIGLEASIKFTIGGVSVEASGPIVQEDLVGGNLTLLDRDTGRLYQKPFHSFTIKNPEKIKATGGGEERFALRVAELDEECQDLKDRAYWAMKALTIAGVVVIRLGGPLNDNGKKYTKEQRGDWHNLLKSIEDAAMALRGRMSPPGHPEDKEI